MKKRISPRRHPIGSPIRSLALAIGLGIASCGFAATDPKAARFYEDALVRYEKEDLPGAIIQLKNALKIDKNMLPVHVLLGKALLDNGDFVAAEVAFQEARSRVNFSTNRVLPRPDCPPGSAISCCW